MNQVAPATADGPHLLLNQAVRAVSAAAIVCERVRATIRSGDSLAKADRSPVTVADFASQAVVAAEVAELGIPLVAEEDAAELVAADAAVRERVLEAVRSVKSEAGEAQVLRWIDAGGADPAAGGRYWVLDPIDGTKGFLRGGQYAVALALVEQGRVVLGVLGCPQWNGGTLFGAGRDGNGAWMAPMATPEAGQPIKVAGERELRLVESVESGHSDHAASEIVARTLEITAEPQRMDSQAKYAAVACGKADVYLRLPTLAGYEERVWDHAAGLVVIEEAGGRVTDVDGKALDFSHGRTLVENRGVVASSNAGGTLHERVLRVVGEVLRG